MKTSTKKIYITVSAAVSTKVVKPPKTPKRINTGSKNSHFESFDTLIAFFKLNGFGTIFSFLPWYNDHTDIIINNKIPGISPAIKISLTETPAVTPYIIAGRLGGNNNPNEPETVINPIENERLYPSFNNSGSNNPPKARIVTPDPPVKVVKKDLLDYMYEEDDS